MLLEGVGMYSVELYRKVRLACRHEGLSSREAARRFGIDRKTVAKILRHSVPPGYQRSQPPRRPKLDPFTGIIDRILEEDRARHRKQRHTAKRIFERLRDEHGFEGKETIVKDYVRERRRSLREMFVPLAHPAGHAQADFGEAVAIIGGVEQKAHFFAMDLPHSDKCFVKAYPAATTEAWLDGHNAAFAFFGGVPQSILYDNDKRLVARILPDGTRQRTQAFSALQSHYLFEDRYGRPGKGNDKGKVEGVVGFTRRNFMVPVPRFESWEVFNADLLRRCHKRGDDVLRGHRESIGERFARDQDALMTLPPAPFEACEKVATRVSSLSLIRYRSNDYSVPVAYGHQEVWIRGYVHEVVIGCGAEIIARHQRSYEREDLIFDPLHYLALLERKIGALDQAAPLQGWDLPEAFASLRRLLEARMGKGGKREYVQVLRLLESFDLEDVHGAVRDAMRLGAIGYDAVKHLVLCRIERRPPRLDLDVYPYLPRARVATTAAATYMSLLAGAGS
jgi:transposase